MWQIGPPLFPVNSANPQYDLSSVVHHFHVTQFPCVLMACKWIYTSSLLSKGWDKEFPFMISNQNFICTLFTSIRVTCPTYLIFLDLVILIIFGEKYIFWSFSPWKFVRTPIISYLLGPNILVSTLFLHTLRWYFSHNVKDQVPHLYKSISKVIVLYIMKCYLLHISLLRQNNTPPGLILISWKNI